MSDPISQQNAEHYVWGDGCDGWHLLRHDALSIIEEQMPPGAREQRHRHAKARQFFYVIDGQLTMEVEGGFHLLRAGEGIEVAPGQRHQVINDSAADARFLVISSPPSHGDRIVS